MHEYTITLNDDQTEALGTRGVEYLQANIDQLLENDVKALQDSRNQKYVDAISSIKPEVLAQVEAILFDEKNQKPEDPAPVDDNQPAA